MLLGFFSERFLLSKTCISKSFSSYFPYSFCFYIKVFDLFWLIIFPSWCVIWVYFLVYVIFLYILVYICFSLHHLLKRLFLYSNEYFWYFSQKLGGCGSVDLFQGLLFSSLSLHICSCVRTMLCWHYGSIAHVEIRYCISRISPSD